MPAHPEQTRIHTMISMMLRPRAAQAGEAFFAPVARRLLTIAATVVAALFVAAPIALADNRFWITNAGGAFSSTTNWQTTNTPPGGASVPGAADVAEFHARKRYLHRDIFC